MSVSRDGAHYGGRHVRRAARPTCFARDKLPHIPLLVSRYDTVLSAGDSGVKVKMFLNSFNTLIEDDAYYAYVLSYWSPLSGNISKDWDNSCSSKLPF